ncbi:MAG: RNA-binding cell elongation regulator Jag/EloR [Thermodesulfobacteriota bacterium]
MEDMTIEGKSIDEAIEKACSAFGVPREKLNIEIVSEGSAGFLGIGAKKVRIRASLMALDLMIDAQDPFPTARPRLADRPEMRTAATAEPFIARRVPPGGCGKQVDRGEAQRDGADGDGEPVREKAKRMLEGLLLRMQVDARVIAEETEEAIILDIQGNGGGFLIGKRGQNLDAIQYIVSKAVHHSANGNKMIIIDTENYRQRREESLVALARRLGERVRKTKKPMTVGHLNAHDRRLIHLAIQNDPTLITKSRGEGDYRKILILPARREAETSED